MNHIGFRIRFILNAMSGSDIPWYYWLIPLSVATLLCLPYFTLLLVDPDPGQAYYGVGYIPKDYLTYLSFIRQVGEESLWPGYNQFTTEPQQGKFLLLFLAFLGFIVEITSWEPVVVHEFSRFPVLLLYFYALWKFLTPIYPDPRHKLWVVLLVGFAGGLEGFIIPLLPFFPEHFYYTVGQATWPLYGWNSFSGLNNPQFSFALSLLLLALRIIFLPVDYWRKQHYVRLAVLFVLIFLVHPYTTIVLGLILVFDPVVRLLLQKPVLGNTYRCWFLSLMIPIAICLGIGVWQIQDPVYSAASAQVLGKQAMPVFWYPLTLGLVLWFSLRGIRYWWQDKNPFVVPCLAWLLAVIVLHTSPLLNGYRFVAYLHLPLCIFAAPVVKNILTKSNTTQLRRLLVAVGLFASVLFTTVWAVTEVRLVNPIPLDYARITDFLKKQNKGKVLAPARLGNMIPAYTHHFVWSGHWFLTPNYSQRNRFYNRIINNPKQIPVLRELLRKESIDYLVATEKQSKHILPALRDRVKKVVEFSEYFLIILN